jgi:hypothetical protein
LPTFTWKIFYAGRLQRIKAAFFQLLLKRHQGKIRGAAMLQDVNLD